MKIKAYFAAVKKNFKPKHYFNYALVSAVLILFFLLEMSGLLKRSHANLLAQIGFSIILAVSLNLVVGFLGELSLGHAGFMCIGAYIGTWFSSLLAPVISSFAIRLVLAMLVGGAAAALFGILVGIPALRLKGDYLAIVTLAFGEIVRNIFKNLPWFGKSFGMQTETYGTKLFIIAFFAVLFTLIIIQNLMRSKHGRAITAIRDSEIAAKSMGVNVTFYKILAFSVAAFFAGIAGVIYGAYTTPILYSFFSFNYSIEILVMVVLGGMGSITGSIISAALLTYINFLLSANLSGDMAALKYMIYALILIGMVIYNNAPAFKKYRDRFGFPVLMDRIRERFVRTTPATVKDDAAAWDRVPTKILSDEVLSTDLQLMTSAPDKPDKPGKPKGDE